ncbi:ABC transporter ATP-binding protein [Paenibacillus sp. 1P07SE]|uniref:ABC transporter ATP-binding protein n=1 Tax=Paenibacillus sp. 1P07SE TaxID=3132209 RepID=UPI0039A5BF84
MKAIWRLRSFLKPYRLAVILAPLLMVMEVCMDLLQPRLMASIIDQGVMTGDLGHIWRTGLWMSLVALVGLVGGIGCTVYSTRAAQGFAADLRVRLFDKVQTFSFDNLDRFSSGSLVTRLTGDVVQMQNMVQMVLRMLVRSPGLAIGSIIMAILISPRLALIFAVIIPIVIVILIVISRRVIPIFGVVQQKLDAINTVLQENLSGIRVVKAFVRAAFEKLRFGKANDDHLEVALKAARTIAINMPLMMLVLNFSVVAALWYGGAQTREGSLPVGDLIAFVNYLTHLLFSLLSVGMMLVAISRAAASAVRIEEVIDTQPAITGPAETGRPAIGEGGIIFEGVSFAYGAASDEYALRDISFAVKPGQTVGILGATGAGKSSLVSLIPRLYDPTSGRVLLDGTDVRDITTKELRTQVGVVLQQAILFTGSIRDNIRYGMPAASDEEVEAAARAAQAHDFIAALPEGYDTQLGQRGVNLSGGQKQRISIARALLLRPAILIMDDSTSAVDLQTEARIQRSLRELMAKSTTLVIAQRIASVIDADQIIVLEHGAVHAIGTHDELMASSSVYREICQSQLRKEETLHV